ncbi:hypothetical protein BH23ACT9_BH23ACT9_24490 [soil metagenome]
MGPQDHADSLTRAVRHALSEVDTETRVVVAVSGGADSVALLHLVVAARPDLTVTVGHVRHGLRGTTADAADAAVVRAQAEQQGVAFVEQVVTVSAGAGPEDAARRARYDALSAIAALAGADTVMLGHTADDQAETLLLRMARGTGVDGLAGMAPRSRRGDLVLVRPLLRLRRAEVRAVLPPGTWAEDLTNDDPDQRRARARHEVLPALGRLRPDEGDAVPALCRLADLARRDAQLLDELVAGSPVLCYGGALLVAREPTGAPTGDAVRSRMLRRAWQHLPGAPPSPSAAVTERILVLANGARLQAPGGVSVTASKRGWVLDPQLPAPSPRTLPVGGSAVLAEHDMVLHCDEVLAPGRSAGGGGGQVAVPVVPDAPPPVVRLDAPPWELHVPWSPGPLQVVTTADQGQATEGLRAVRRVLQDLVPAGLRHLVPVLTDAEGHVLSVGSRPVARVQAGQLGLRVRGTLRKDGVGYPADA